MSVFDKFFTEREERKLLSTIRQYKCLYAQRDYWWMVLMRNTALRVGVLHGLTIEDAEKAMGSEYLHVRPEINKRKTMQDIYLTKNAKSAIKHLLKLHRSICEAARGIDWDLARPDRPLILSRKLHGDDKSMSIRAFQDRMKYWDKKSELNIGCTPHWWRHTWARRALTNSTNTELTLCRIQEVLGHKDINTSRVYTQPNKEDIQEIMRDAQQ